MRQYLRWIAPLLLLASIANAGPFAISAGGAASVVGPTLATPGGVILDSTTAPTISSGFGTGASITAAHTSAFTINVGTGGTASTGVLTMPSSPGGWNCTFEDQTSYSTSAFKTRQTANTSTSVTLGNYNSTPASGAWPASDIILAKCTGM